jgi:hypothetical protein
MKWSEIKVLRRESSWMKHESENAKEQAHPGIAITAWTKQMSSSVSFLLYPLRLAKQILISNYIYTVPSAATDFRALQHTIQAV